MQGKERKEVQKICKGKKEKRCKARKQIRKKY